MYLKKLSPLYIIKKENSLPLVKNGITLYFISLKITSVAEYFFTFPLLIIVNCLFMSFVYFFSSGECAFFFLVCEWLICSKGFVRASVYILSWFAFKSCSLCLSTCECLQFLPRQIYQVSHMWSYLVSCFDSHSPQQVMLNIDRRGVLGKVLGFTFQSLPTSPTGCVTLDELPKPS